MKASDQSDEIEALQLRIAELEGERDSVAALLQCAEQCTAEELSPHGVSNEVVASHIRDHMIAIYEQLSNHFLDETGDLGQPYGNGFDAIRDAVGRLIADSESLGKYRSGQLPPADRGGCGFWSDDPEGMGMEWHSTWEEARKAACDAIDGWSDPSHAEQGEWPDAINYVRWGIVIESATPVIVDDGGDDDCGRSRAVSGFRLKRVRDDDN